MFDRRIIFVGTFFFTLWSTVLVAFVSFATEQGVLYTVLYSLATMWITGIISQVILQNLYQGIVRPLEEQQTDRRKEEKKQEINLDEVEAIDEAMDRVKVAIKEGNTDEAQADMAIEMKG